MSFFNELKRRNVFRVGIAYVVVAWLVMQVADVVINNIEAPGWGFQVIMLVLGIGFPIVIIFAWAFEMTPEGLKKEKDVDRSQSITPQTGRKLDRMIIGIMAVVIAFLVLDRFVLNDSAGPQDQAADTELVVTDNTPEAEATAGPSVAVLPFVNMSEDASNEYFSDGLTETLLHMLAQLPDLHVAARTSSFAFKGQNSSIEEIATALGVAHILEGSVQKSGERVRITAQLIRADDGFHVWSQNYDRTLVDIFAIQDEIATDVAGALDSSLLGGGTQTMHSVETSNLTAFESYLKGLEQQAIYSYGSMAVAESHFKQALARDPAFTDARMALARNYLLKNGTGLITDEEARQQIEPLIRQAREQDPDSRLARAFELMIMLGVNTFNLEASERIQILQELRGLLALVPTETYIRMRVAGMLNGLMDDSQAAVEVLQAGLLIDPLAADLHGQLGEIYLADRRIDNARTEIEKAQQLAPDNPNHYNLLSELEKESNNLPAALEWTRRAIEVDPQDHELAAVLAQDLYNLELPEEGDRWYARVKALSPDSPVTRRVELDRAMARKDYAQAERLARSMISDQVENRQGSFFVAVLWFTDLMFKAGTEKNGYEFLVSVRPEITNYDVLPLDFKGRLMQWMSIALMTGFESFDVRRQAWLKHSAALDARGIPWRQPERAATTWDNIMKGDTQGAATHYLEHRLSVPMAGNLNRHKRYFEPLYRDVLADPEVAARLVDKDAEFAQLRETVSELMLEPEWNQ
jgi:TolB-like protein/Tfp pilus assembly protein PilF